MEIFRWSLLKNKLLASLYRSEQMQLVKYILLQLLLTQQWNLSGISENNRSGNNCLYEALSRIEENGFCS
jgi:hypothetical protein